MSLGFYAQNVVSFLSVLTVAGQIIVVALIASLVTGMLPAIRAFVSRNILWLLFVAPVVGMIGSLYFSEMAGWTPCKDCWFQRIFLYPQVVILALALWKRDKGVVPYVLLLSLIGIVFSIQHYALQVDAALHPADPTVPCDDTGVSCASTPFFRFGYITIPMMAMTAFAMNIVGSVIALRLRKA